MLLRVGGREIENPMVIWREYARNYPRTIREYDFGDPGDPNVLTAKEAWRSRIIHSRLSSRECDDVVSRAKEAPWTGVPADADLGAADPTQAGGSFAAAAGLYWFFTWPERISGVGPAKMHKILHLKRPGLYPILDERVREFYRSPALAWLERLSYLEGVSATDSPPYWAAFWDDLTSNREALDDYCIQLAQDPDETVQLMAKLTAVRLQDILAWTIATAKGPASG